MFPHAGNKQCRHFQIDFDSINDGTIFRKFDRSNKMLGFDMNVMTDYFSLNNNYKIPKKKQYRNRFSVNIIVFTDVFSPSTIKEKQNTTASIYRHDKSIFFQKSPEQLMTGDKTRENEIDFRMRFPTEMIDRKNGHATL